MLCCATESNDVVVVLRYKLDMRIASSALEFQSCLVVRQLRDDVFEIIGQGLMVVGWAICQGGDQCNCSHVKHELTETPGFDIHLDRDDLLAFVALSIDEWKFKGDPMEPYATIGLAPLIERRLCAGFTSTRLSSFAIARR